jgi:uncharacterized protein (DUF1810 family)
MESLDRFKIAQAGSYERALQEIKAGNKSNHWIWYIFPQIQGLGISANSILYSIKNLEEAKSYLLDEILSARYIQLTEILANEVNGKTAKDIFYSDAKKFKSSLTLFIMTIERYPELNANGRFQSIFRCLEKYFKGHLDLKTLKKLEMAKLSRNDFLHPNNCE